ncbi:sodium:solute symporter family protein [Nesterenkonia alkaliphila]|uniref:Sodium:proline symporter n=1 Tax=Nesterenkonia alkaliphila TaxID=1463631 RepID=A0A7K1ULA3_9MICC|nr:sodium:solute symporter family protein [Nesterenkonia alkaliphila]MVT27268.1 sodium:proline symporter [Nesterenkonia alkaliphila]GFZ78196.1 sodium:proline symporter [Nesterenkonia alkaliphila]
MDNSSPILSTSTVLLLLVAFYGFTLYMAMRIRRRKENADAYMTAGNGVGFGIAAASMTATWIWASSMYASATSGYTYGISGPIHYGLWGAFMILFIYPFGRRIRQVAPKAHTLAEVMRARHGSSSQLLLAGSNVVGSLISLMSNLVAGGALIALFSPLSFVQGVLAVATGVLLYTFWSGFRASALTDFMQVMVMMLLVGIIIPIIFFSAGFPSAFETGAGNLTAEQSNFFSSEAFMHQGAPYIAAVLAYAIGNQTIAQRLFAVREDLIKPTFITATIGYAGMVIGVGMIGVLALYLGMEPLDGDSNNIIPQMAADYLPTVLVALFLIMIIGALSSTADSDLSALSSIVMADIYGQNIASRGKARPKVMLFVGRVTMIVATTAAVVLAGLQLDILDMLVFVGALWGALVFPVIASFYWEKITNLSFVVAVLSALAVFIPVRFDWVPLEITLFAFTIDVLAAVGVGVVLGLMAFGFFGLRAGKITGVLATLLTLPFALGSLHEYTVLSASLVAYSVSTLIVLAMCLRNNRSFDFSTVQQRVGNFDDDDAAQDEKPGIEPVGAPAGAAGKEK